MGKRTLEYDKSKGQELWLPCVKCHGKTCHLVLSSVDSTYSEDYETDEGYTYKDAFYTLHTKQIVQCQGCKILSFRSDYDDSEQPNWDDPGGPIDHEELYPSRVAGRHKLEKDYLLPQKVRRIYNEAHTALSNRLLVLAGVGIRALIEAVCKEKKQVVET